MMHQVVTSPGIPDDPYSFDKVGIKTYRDGRQYGVIYRVINGDWDLSEARALTELNLFLNRLPTWSAWY